MALTRKFLAAMGIEEDKIEEIISAHTDTVNGLKEQVDKFRADAEKLPETEERLAKANKKIADLENEDKDSPFKQQYEELQKETKKLQKEFDDYKADIDAKAVLSKKTDAYKKLLKDAGISEKRINSVLKVSSIDDLEFEEDGSLKDAESLSEKIKDEWSDFIVEKHEQGAGTPKPPEGTGGSGREDSIASRLAAEYHANLYGSSKEE